MLRKGWRSSLRRPQNKLHQFKDAGIPTKWIWAFFISSLLSFIISRWYSFAIFHVHFPFDKIYKNCNLQNIVMNTSDNEALTLKG